MLSALSLRTRIALLSTIPVTVLVVLVCIFAYTRWQQLREIRTLETLSAITKLSGDLIHELQFERSYSTQFALSAGAAGSAKLREHRTMFDTKRGDYETAVQQHLSATSTDFQESVRRTQLLLQQLPDKRGKIDAMLLTAAQINDYYSTTIDSIITDVEFLGNIATFDVNSSRMVLGYINLIKLKERLSREQSVLFGIFTRDTATKDEFMKGVRIASEQFTLAAIFRGLVSPEQVKNFDNLVRNDLGLRIRTMRRTVTDRYPAGGFGIQAGEWFDITTEQLQRGKDFEFNLSTEMTAQIDGLQRRVITMLMILTGVIAMILGIVIMLSLRITRTIRKPIRDLVKGAEHVEAGDFTISVPIHAKDEIGRFTATFNRMIENINSDRATLQAEKASVEDKVRSAVRSIEQQQQQLQTSVHQMLNAMEHFAKGDLTQTITGAAQDDIKRLYDGYNEALRNIRTMVAQVQMVVQTTSASTAEIIANMNNVSRDISTQTQQIDNIASAMEQMNTTIAETTQQTTQASQKAADAEREASSGGAIVAETLASVQSVGNLVMRSAESIQALNRSSEQIGVVIQVIDEIADQTNLLALNAAIEAARAGDHGRGFAVVADEVRKLAERTQQATKEISSTIKQIQQQTQDVVHEMNVGAQEVEKGNTSAARAKEALERIITRSKEVSGIVGQVAIASEEQASSVEMIVSNVDSINHLAKESLSVVEKTQADTQNLAQLTNDLEYLVGQFRIESGVSSTMMPNTPRRNPRLLA